MIEVLMLTLTITATVSAVVFALALWFYLFGTAMDAIFTHTRGVVTFILAVPTFVFFITVLMLSVAAIIGALDVPV